MAIYLFFLRKPYFHREKNSSGFSKGLPAEGETSDTTLQNFYRLTLYFNYKLISFLGLVYTLRLTTEVVLLSVSS